MLNDVLPWRLHIPYNGSFTTDQDMDWVSGCFVESISIWVSLFRLIAPIPWNLGTDIYPRAAVKRQFKLDWGYQTNIGIINPQFLRIGAEHLCMPARCWEDPPAPYSRPKFQRLRSPSVPVFILRYRYQAFAASRAGAVLPLMIS